MSKTNDVDAASVHPIVTTRFLAVVHNWFVHSEGWHVEELAATTRPEAEKEAAVLFRQHNRPFSKADVKVVELQTGEHLPQQKVPGEKLTIWERIVGRVSSS
jgi:hypothetical protein